MKQTACPACGQGWVVPARVKATGVTLFVCEECETIWFSAADIGGESPVCFMDYMETQGLRGLWTEIELLPAELE